MAWRRKRKVVLYGTAVAELDEGEAVKSELDRVERAITEEKQYSGAIVKARPPAMLRRDSMARPYWIVDGMSMKIDYFGVYDCVRMLEGEIRLS